MACTLDTTGSDDFFCISFNISSPLAIWTLPIREDGKEVEEEEGTKGRASRCGLANVASGTVLSIESNRLDAPVSCFHSIPPFDSIIPRPSPDGVGNVVDVEDEGDELGLALKSREPKPIVG